MPRPPAASLLNDLIRPYRRRLRLPLILAMLGMGLLIVQTALLAMIFADWLNALARNIPPQADILQQNAPYLLLCFVLRPSLNVFKDILLQRLSLLVRGDLRRRLLDALTTLGPARAHIGNDGALSMQILEQVDALDGFISRFYVQSRVAALTPLLIAAAVCFHSPLAAGLLLLSAPLVPVFMILVGSLAAEKSREQLQVLEQLGGRFLDLLRGLPTLRRLRAQQWAQREVLSAAGAYQRSSMRVLRLAFLSGAVLELFSALAIALVAVYLGLGLLGILPWAKGEVPVPYQSALFILLLAPEFYLPLRQLGSDYHAKAQAQAAIESLQGLLQTPALPEADGEAPLTSQPPQIRLHHLSIQTSERRRRLAALSAEIAAAERIGIIGRSGSGKSSLLEALLGFATYQGEIRINGIALNTIKRSDWQRHIAYLAQSPSLMRGSIAANLRLAQADADDAALQAVLEQVGLWKAIACLPQGINTCLGERGSGLSGGQQQRLCLAQLLLRDAPLWLIDEPCAHLDAETAAEIYALLGELSRGKTLILVGHDIGALPWLDGLIDLERR